MQNQPILLLNPEQNEPSLSIDLVFDGNEVKGAWYHPKLAKVFCALCKDEETCEGMCVNVNPYCG